MTRIWQLQEAKARFSELFNKVYAEGPQRISRHGKQMVVILSESDYQNLSQQSQRFIDFLLSAPKADLDIERTRDFGREIVV